MHKNSPKRTFPDKPMKSDATPLPNPLGYEKLTKLLRSYAVPSVIAMLVSSMYNIVDQIFIGQGIGYLGNAATNVVFPLTTICLTFSLLIGVGSAIRVLLALGSDRREEAAKIAGNAFVLIAAVGLLYLAVIQLFCRPLLTLFGATAEVMPYAETYMRITALGMPLLIAINAGSQLIRADGSPRYSMVCNAAGAVINTILDPLFIFGLDMGIAGAAWATVISQAVSFAIAVAYIPRFKQIRLSSTHLRFSLSETGKMAAFGMSHSVTQLSLTLVQIVLNNALTRYGAMSEYGSEIPLAACGIVLKINAVLIGIIIGISQGAQPIMSFNYGAGKYNRVRKIYLLAVACDIAAATAGFLILQLFPRQIISLFGTGDELYFEFAVRFLRTYLLMLPLNGVQMISSNFFSATGKPAVGAFLSLSRQVLLTIPGILILSAVWGLDGILFAAPIADFTAFALSAAFVAVRFARMRRAEKTNTAV